MRKPLSDQEINRELGTRTVEELISFREKLKKINTPQSWTLRFFIVKELLRRAHGA